MAPRTLVSRHRCCCACLCCCCFAADCLRAWPAGVLGPSLRPSAAQDHQRTAAAAVAQVWPQGAVWCSTVQQPHMLSVADTADELVGARNCILLQWVCKPAGALTWLWKTCSSGTDSSTVPWGMSRVATRHLPYSECSSTATGRSDTFKSSAHLSSTS
jgi:hypothetical protein